MSLKSNGSNEMFKVVNLYNSINKRVKLYKTYNYQKQKSIRIQNYFLHNKEVN